jgi:23S rRNA (guanosine2251-2'-O)-methyltransferase
VAAGGVDSRGRRRRSRRHTGSATERAAEGAQVFGIHAVQSLLASDPTRLHKLMVQRDSRNPRLAALIAAAERAGVSPAFVDRAELDSMASAPHQGVIADCEPAPVAAEAELEWRLPQLGPAPLLLALDGVLDPRNLGACLRSADAAGVAAVLLPRNRRAPLSAVARKAASGAAETLFIVEVANLARRLQWLRDNGAHVVGAAGDAGRPFTSAAMTAATVIVVGGESGGLRRLTRDHCDELISIPMLGAVTSLNVSVATGILLFEAVRQRSGG